MTAPVLAVEEIGKSFKGFRAVERVSFTVEAGELLALIGPNGAGKTTTFNMINGQLAPDHGRVSLGGEDVTHWPPRALWRAGGGSAPRDRGTPRPPSGARLVETRHRAHEPGGPTRRADAEVA